MRLKRQEEDNRDLVPVWSPEASMELSYCICRGRDGEFKRLYRDYSEALAVYRNLFG